MLSAKSLIGTHDVLLVTFDTLRFDVAEDALRRGMTPNLASILPSGRWERRHSPGNFTYAAHHAFFAGFLPTPATPGPHPRLFASRFAGSETTCEQRTWVFDEPNLVHALAAHDYHTICVGGVGFFNLQSALGRVLPGLFSESHWDASLGVTDRKSTENQVAVALAALGRQPRDKRVFMFVNLSALHQPNCIYVDGRQSDDASTQAAALAYVDRCLPRLWDGMMARAPVLTILTSDHGTAYGEEGYEGHRLAHPVVWDVPYAELILPRQQAG